MLVEAPRMFNIGYFGDNVKHLLNLRGAVILIERFQDEVYKSPSDHSGREKIEQLGRNFG